VERAQWQGFFDRLADDMAGQHVVVEVLDGEAGDQIEADGVPFASSAYDPRDDVVEIAMGGTTQQHPVVLRHLINHPTAVDVTTANGSTVVRVDSREDGTSLVSFHSPAALPPA
jgi:Family of unknown function (DUF5335)